MVAAVILLTTLHILLTLYSVILMVSTCASVVTLYWVLGIKAGIVEAYGLVIVQTFAIQYIVHIVINYRFNRQQTRKLRTTASVSGHGSSILAHCILSILCGAAIMYTATGVYYAPQLHEELNTDFITLSSTVLLKKVGFLLAAAALAAAVHSLIFLVAVLHAIGPLEDCCSLTLIF